MLQLQLTSRDERKTVDELLITRKEAGPWKEKLLISGIKLFDDDFVERESTRERVERMVADISLSLSKDRAAAATTNRTLLRIISWSKPEEGWVKVYPLVGAMAFVTSMCVFQLTRNVFLNPAVRINKSDRSKAVLENYEEGEKYAEHGLRKFLRTRPPEIMPAVNHFFSRNE
ncbi:hypothetical protein V6N13_046027 [Hibiscus sabdariffa]